MITRSLSWKFLSTIIPIFLGVFIFFVGFYEWATYHKAHEELILRIDKMAASQSIILAASIANGDTNQLSLLLASIISDPDLIGVAVYDNNGAVLDSFGAQVPGDGDLVKEMTINFADNGNVRSVGLLKLVMTERFLLQELQQHLIEDSFLALVLLLAALIGTIIAHRRIVMRPLDKLLSAINETKGGAFGRVAWTSDDEIGRVIASYNDMQSRLDSYESELKAIQEQLELRVEERTRELVIARETAEKASRAKSTFLSSMSHEFRTPMNAILGFTQILQMSPDVRDNPRLLDRLNKIEDSARSLMTLLDDIMDFARMESADVDWLGDETAPLQTVNDAVALVLPLAESRQVTITVNGSDDEAGMLRADRAKLEKALLNLLSNAVKYNRPGGHVSIDVGRDGEALRITIHDTGYGIPADQQDNIFEPFNRVGREAGAIEGTGIGLTITQRIIENMNGKIEFDSVEGEGSTFTLTFPRAA